MGSGWASLTSGAQADLPALCPVLGSKAGAGVRPQRAAFICHLGMTVPAPHRNWGGGAYWKESTGSSRPREDFTVLFEEPGPGLAANRMPLPVPEAA